MRTPRLLPLILAAAALSACGQPPSDKAGRLLSMAAEEAATIPNRLDRFTRQLNIADTQLMTNLTTTTTTTMPTSSGPCAAISPSQP